MSNLIDEKANVNTNENISIKYPFTQISNRAINELMFRRPALFALLVYIQRNHCTYKYGLVGVHKELTQSRLAKELKKDVKNTIRDLEVLQDLGFIKIFHKTPLLMQIQHIEGIDTIKDLKSLILLISTNTNDFNLSKYVDWKKELNSMLMKMTEDDVFGFAPFTS